MKQYLVDAFTSRLFHGNQAAVCVPESWPEDELMRQIAAENNLSETAFAVKIARGYQIRWFTPRSEIDCCGHATLAAAYVIFNFLETELTQLRFESKAGELSVTRCGELIALNFPAYPLHATAVTDDLSAAVGVGVKEACAARDLLLVVEREEQVLNLRPDFARLAALRWPIIAVTAQGRDYDCVSRCFAPSLGIDEDPVTGSTHCLITPYWCRTLGRSTLKCYQASERGGVLHTRLEQERVIISGQAVLFAQSELMV